MTIFIKSEAPKIWDGQTDKWSYRVDIQKERICYISFILKKRLYEKLVPLFFDDARQTAGLIKSYTGYSLVQKIITENYS